MSRHAAGAAVAAGVTVGEVPSGGGVEGVVKLSVGVEVEVAVNVSVGEPVGGATLRRALTLGGEGGDA